MINDKNIKNKFNHCGICKSKINSLSIEEKDYLRNRFNDSDSLKESIFRIKVGNLEVKPLCPECGKPVKIRYRVNNPLYKTCGNKECIHKRKSHGPEEANLIKYGVKNQFQRPEIKEQIMKHNLEVYGCKSHMQNKEWMKRYEEANLIKYGVKNQFQRPEIKEQIIKHNLEVYGVDHFSKTNIYKEKMSKIASSKEFQEKRNKTLTKNNTWNKSKQEEYVYKKLISKFNNVKRQYYSDLYPFKCDFYINDLNLYIEYNGSDLHNDHPFTGSKDDLIEIEKIKQKAAVIKEKTGKNISRYDNKIKIWTISDVNKRNIAKINNLNYKEFFNLKEFDNWFNNLNI